MIKVLIFDNEDRANRKLSVHSVGHATTDTCIAISALVNTFAAFLLGIELENPDSVYVEAKQGDGEMCVTAKSTDFWNPWMDTTLTTAIHMLTTGVANYAHVSEGAIEYTYVNSMDGFIAWNNENRTGQALCSMDSNPIKPEKLTFEPWDN